MAHDRNQGRDLGATREALASWRRLHGGRGRPIPAEYWSRAADVALANGVAETARALGVDARKLAKLVEARAKSAAPAFMGPAQFVELGGLTLGEPPRAVLELVGREGDRVRVEVVGAAGAAAGFVTLARAFWDRGA